MKKLDEAIDRVTGIHVVRAGKPAPLAVWMAFHSAVLALLAAIAEWRKGPRLCVAILATDPADRVLLVRTARGWELPGGKVQDEPWQDAARREAREETGLEVTLTGAPQVLNGEPAPGAAYRSVVLVARARAEGTPTAGDDALEAAWFARAELPWGALSELVSVEALRAWATERRADGVVYAPWFPGPRPAEMAVVADCTCVSIGPRDSVLDHDDHCDLYDRVPMSEVLAEEDRIAAENATARARDAAPLDELDMLRLAADAPPTEPECECTSLRGGDSPEDHDDACPVNPRNKP